MTISRRAAWFLCGFAVWNTFVWVTFVKNVFPDHHFDGFFLVHLAIGGVTTALGLGAGAIGLGALLRARKASSTGARPAPSAGAAAEGGRPGVTADARRGL